MRRALPVAAGGRAAPAVGLLPATRRPTSSRSRPGEDRRRHARAAPDEAGRRRGGLHARHGTPAADGLPREAPVPRRRARRRPGHAPRPARGQPVGLVVRALPAGDADPPVLPRGVRRAGAGARHRLRGPADRRGARARAEDRCDLPAAGGPPGDLRPVVASRTSPWWTRTARSSTRSTSSSSRRTSWSTWSTSTSEPTCERADGGGIELPEWLRPVREGADSITVDDLTRFMPPEGTDARRGAVLMLFGEGEHGRRAAAHRARPRHALASRPGVLPRRVDRPGRDAGRGGAARGAGGDRTGPGRGRGLRRAARAVAAAEQLRGHAGARLVGGAHRRVAWSSPDEVHAVHRVPIERAARPRAPGHACAPQRLARARAS